MKKKTSLLIAYGFIALAVFMFVQYSVSPTVINVSYTQFKKLVTGDTINSVVISTNFLKGFEIIPENKKEPLFPKQSYLTPRVDDKNIVDFLEKNEVDIIAQNENTFLMSLISWVLPPLFFVGIWFFLMRRMGQSAGTGIMTLGKNKAKLVAQQDIGITFKDVAGQQSLPAWAPGFPKVFSLSVPLELARLFLLKRWQGKQAFLSFPSVVRILSRCLWGLVQRVSVTFSIKRKRLHPA
jgi:ATP-dependent Zn protease